MQVLLFHMIFFDFGENIKSETLTTVQNALRAVVWSFFTCLANSFFDLVSKTKKRPGFVANEKPFSM